MTELFVPISVTERVPLLRRTGREIAAEIARLHGLTLADLAGPNKTRRIVRVRQKAYVALREGTRLSLPQIGRVFGGRHHTTVLCGIREHYRREARQ